MLNLSQQQLADAVAQLDQAIYNHDQWYKNLVRTLLARLPPDAGDLAPDANHRCRFGQIGVAGLADDAPVEAAIDHADRALYAAKEQGRNRVSCWDQ